MSEIITMISARNQSFKVTLTLINIDVNYGLCGVCLLKHYTLEFGHQETSQRCKPTFGLTINKRTRNFNWLDQHGCQ